MDPAVTKTPDVTSSNSQGSKQDHNTSQAHTVQTEPGTAGDENTVGGQDTQESSESNGSEDKKEEELTLDPSSQTGAYPFFTSPCRIHLSFSSTKRISYPRIASREILVTTTSSRHPVSPQIGRASCRERVL